MQFFILYLFFNQIIAWPIYHIEISGKRSDNKQITLVNETQFDNPLGNLDFNTDRSLLKFQIFSKSLPLLMIYDDFQYQLFEDRYFFYKLVIYESLSNDQLILKSEDFWVKSQYVSTSLYLKRIDEINRISHLHKLKVNFRKKTKLMKDPDSLLNSGLFVECIYLDFLESTSNATLNYTFCSKDGIMSSEIQNLFN